MKKQVLIAALLLSSLFKLSAQINHSLYLLTGIENGAYYTSQNGHLGLGYDFMMGKHWSIGTTVGIAKGKYRNDMVTYGAIPLYEYERTLHADIALQYDVLKSTSRHDLRFGLGAAYLNTKVDGIRSITYDETTNQLSNEERNKQTYQNIWYNFVIGYNYNITKHINVGLKASAKFYPEGFTNNTFTYKDIISEGSYSLGSGTQGNAGILALLLRIGYTF